MQSSRTGAIVYANRAFEQVLGYARADVLNQRDAQYDAFTQQRRSRPRTDWLPITAIGRNGQPIALQICSERDESPEGLRITVLRLPGPATSVLPTQYAPLEA